MTANVDFGLPYNVSNPADAVAANRSMAFQFAWYYDPIVFGKYPDEMTQLITDGRLPTFTPEEAKMVKGSYDFIGMNHYTSYFTNDVPEALDKNWWSDSRTKTGNTGIDG